jgi:hypothetical protein
VTKVLNIIGLETPFDILWIEFFLIRISFLKTFLLTMATALKRHPSNSTSEDDDDGVECPLSGAEALAACKEFASATSTDTGLAMMMLQKHEWNLQRAISAYQDSTSGKSKPSRKPVKTKSQKPTTSVISLGRRSVIFSRCLAVE